MTTLPPDVAVLGLPALVVAPLLLGATITGRGVTIRITEVEAYMGEHDPGSHAYRGRRNRNAHLFGPPGTLYAYRSYGIHTCCNVVSGPDGVASGSLLRGGEVVDGLPTARERRGAGIADRGLARGPGNLGQALGARLDDDGTTLLGAGPHADGAPVADSGPHTDGGPYSLRLAPLPGLEARVAAVADLALDDLAGVAARLADGPPLPSAVAAGPRTGVRGVAGGAGFPWRFWLAGDPTVSAHRRHPQALD